MPTKPQLGRNLYRDLLRRGRENTQAMREALRRLVEDRPGPQAQAMLVTKIAMANGNLEAIFAELDEIGQTAKELR
jgi:hypothetical protein